MAGLGFQKSLDCFLTNGQPSPRELIYVDPLENNVHFSFESGIIVKFNDTFVRHWIYPEECLNEIGETIAKTKSRLDEEGRSNRFIQASHIIRDIQLGVDNVQIMRKYNLEAKTFLLVLDKLVSEGRLEEKEATDRKAMVYLLDFKEYRCAKCGDKQYAHLRKCPKCGGKMAVFDEALPRTENQPVF